MALFPKIAQPCPYLDRFDSVMDGDFCRMCKRTVTDLTDMTDAQRAAFMRETRGDSCITYKTRMSPAVAAMALAASAAVLVPAPAMAQQGKARPHVRAPKPVRPPVVEPQLYLLGGVPPPVMPVQEAPKPPVAPAQAVLPPPPATKPD